MWSAVVRRLRGTDGWLAVDPHRVAWLRTSPLGRAAAGILGVALVGLTVYVKFGGIREAGIVDPALVRWVLGWAPSLLATAAAPFLVVASGTFGDTNEMNLGGVEFLAESLVALPVVVFLEIDDGWSPGNRFDPWDVVAAVAGVLMAFLLLRLLVRKRGRAS